MGFAETLGGLLNVFYDSKVQGRHEAKRIYLEFFSRLFRNKETNSGVSPCSVDKQSHVLSEYYYI